MSTVSFSVDSMIRGYHEYMLIWESPSVGERLACEREPGNAHDTHAVAIKKVIDGEIKIVGHIPKKISAICSIFIRRGGNVMCQVAGARRYSSDLVQGGLEIPCILKFVAANQKEVTKTIRLLESALNIEKVFTASPADSGDSPQASCSTMNNNRDVTSGAANHERVEKDEDNSMDKADGRDLSQASCSTLAVSNGGESHRTKDNSMDMMIDLTESTNSPPSKKQKLFDAENIIMGVELTDAEINYGQRLLKEKHPKVNGLRTTLYQCRMQDGENSVQVVHCPSRFHWITVTTINCKANEVRVFDSLFSYCDKQTISIIRNLYQTGSEELKITMCRCQKQTESKDCGLFSLAFAVALVFKLNPSKIKFHQKKMRGHLVDCFTKKVMTPFPCK